MCNNWGLLGVADFNSVKGFCMQIKKSNLASGIEKYFVLAAVCTVFVVLLFRNSGINLVVSDEYIYSKSARLLPFAYSDFPNYLYFFIYRVTNVCGGGFLDCARLLNSLFFVAAAPFIYLIARKVCTKNIASIVAWLALLGPVNSYTAYFMPESMYFFSFWLLTWFVIRLDDSSGKRVWCFAGMLLGLAALVKPHQYIMQRWGDILLNDPAYSPNLSLDHADFSLSWPPRVHI